MSVDTQENLVTLSPDMFFGRLTSFAASSQSTGFDRKAGSNFAQEIKRLCETEIKAKHAKYAQDGMVRIVPSNQLNELFRDLITSKNTASDLKDLIIAEYEDLSRGAVLLKEDKDPQFNLQDKAITSLNNLSLFEATMVGSLGSTLIASGANMTFGKGYDGKKKPVWTRVLGVCEMAMGAVPTFFAVKNLLDLVNEHHNGRDANLPPRGSFLGGRF